MIWLLGGYMWLFVHRPFEVWPVLGALQIERVYMLVMFGVWLFWPNKGWIPNRNHYALAAFTIVLVVSWLLSPYMDRPICSDTAENYFKVAVFYVMVVTTVRDERGLRLLLLMFLGALGLYMAHSLLEFLNGRYMWRMGIRRMMGVDVTFSDPNAFASGLLYSLPLTMPLWASRPSWPMRLLLLVYTLCVCVCIALTGSRAGLIGLCAFTLMALFVTVRRKLLLLVLCALVGTAGLGVAVVALPAELQNRYLTLIDSSYGPQGAAQSASGRLDGFLLGIEAWERSPLLGHGPRGFDFATGRLGGAHNLYGEVLSELGLLGALALAGLVVCYALNCWEVRSHYRRHPEQPRDLPFHVARSIGLMVVLLLLMGWSGHNLFRYNWQWFAAFQAIAVHCVRRQKTALAIRPAARTARLPYFVGRPTGRRAASSWPAGG